MQKKPTYEELEQRVKYLEQEAARRKKGEEALRENGKNLDVLLAELAAKNAEIESFVYMVFHDLKTPIVTIEGFVGVLYEDFGRILPEDGKKCLGHISEATRKMELLISDLLKLSRIERVRGKKGELPLAKLVKSALKSVQLQVKTREIAVNVQENLPVVYGLKKRLTQVIENLLTNAVKYIGEDNHNPRIDIGVQEQDGRKVFFVRDNGIGIEEKQFDKIFEIFQRLPSAKRIAEGTGIGLTIVKRTIENHGGKIWLMSRTGKGSTFYFTLEGKEA